MTKRKRTLRERARKWDYALSIAEAVVLGYRLAGQRAGKKETLLDLAYHGVRCGPVVGFGHE